MYPCFMCVKIYNTIGGLQAHTLLEHCHKDLGKESA